MNWNGRYKAFTLSYDDGVESDKHFLEIINRYGLKCTFNLNSGLFDDPAYDWIYDNHYTVKRLKSEGLVELYEGHEIAAHGLMHVNPADLKSEEEFAAEILADRKKLTHIFGTEPVGFAYPYGYYDDRTVERLRKAGFLYARTVWDSLNFDLPEDLLRLRPTCHHNNEEVFALLDRFLAAEPDPERPQLFYLWGHAYEFDGKNNWDHLERICDKIAGRDDVFYGTNREVLVKEET